MTQTHRTALITGGAKRIGKAIVEDLAAHGFAVAIHFNNSGDEALALAHELRDQGIHAKAVEADLCDLAAVDRLIDEATRAIGPVTLLVNNASIFESDEITDFDWETWDRHFDVHVKAPALLAQRFAHALPEGENGLIVNVIDQRVWKPTPRYFSYALSKSAMWSMTKTMAQALAPKIRVNAIGPGPTLPSTRQQPGDMDAQVDGLILKKGPLLSEFGATIRYLWETRSVTGQMIALDGGQHLAWKTPDVTGMSE